ncbi:hypothetical protein AB8O55_06630 [Saccharopolyspora cebuensis]|uniref:Uncharacterized protein n=1 Tax=Saccharopolyspora cebuensis TaxID=418759 RepID=A0ABV4CGE5_9PSEU
MAVGVSALARGLAAVAVRVALVSAAVLLNDQFHDRSGAAAGYVLAGAVALRWLVRGPGAFRLWDRSSPRRSRWGQVLQAVGVVGQAAVVAGLLLHYATARLADLRFDLVLAALAAAQVLPAVLQLLGQRLAGVGTAIPITAGRIARTAFGWAVYIAFAAAARFLGEGAAIALWWVPEQAVAWLPTWLPRWLSLGATGLLWLIVIGFATGVLQYRTAHLTRTTTIHQNGPYLTEHSHEVELEPPPRTGLTPVLHWQTEVVLDFEESTSGTGAGSAGHWIGTYTGHSHVVAKLLQVRFPPEHVPCWLHFLR